MVNSIHEDVVDKGKDVGTKKKQKSFVFKLILPYARSFGYIWKKLADRAERKGKTDAFTLQVRVKQDKLLAMAGYPGQLTSDEFAGVAVFSAFTFFILGVLTALMLESYYLPLSLSGFISGAFLPVIWLNDRISWRHKMIQRALPYALDLLTLGVEAGLDFTQSLQRIIKKLGDTPLAEEFQQTLQEITVGKTRSEAMRDMATRVNLQDMTSFISSLIQAEELGASLGPILRIQSEQMRVKRSQRAEEMAMKAPVKIIFPLVIFIFPATFLVILGPLFIKYLT